MGTHAWQACTEAAWLAGPPSYRPNKPSKNNVKRADLHGAAAVWMVQAGAALLGLYHTAPRVLTQYTLWLPANKRLAMLGPSQQISTDTQLRQPQQTRLL